MDAAHSGRSRSPGHKSAEIRSIYVAPEPVSHADRHIALVGTYLPRKCGIATFTADLREQLNAFHPGIAIDVYPLRNPEDAAREPRAISEQDPASYIRAANAINEANVDAVWLQHEYGIFGGPDGEMVCDFVDRLAPPLILTCHTVLADPTPRQLEILRHLVSRASQIMVMSAYSRDLLAEKYGARREILAIIEHGAPDRPFGRQAEFKARLGLSGRKVMMTFGLLGPGKGIETAIQALPGIIERHPETVYRIVGATHPNLVASHGEQYRESLIALTKELGVCDHVLWDNRFLDTEELLDQLEACDIYITPYAGLQQSTSGTLSYAVALGKATISTPYVHARELLSGGVGYLIEPGSSEAITTAANVLLDDPDRLLKTQRRAYARGRETIWPRFADAAAALVESAVSPNPRPAPLAAVPGLTAVFSMSDATGILQHSVGIIPDRNHGYCLDDNVRALMLMNAHEVIDCATRSRWSMIYASFIQHAWNPDARHFRNFMTFERTWCEEVGSQDSNGRTLWALGDTIERSADPDLRAWARNLYEGVLESLSELDSPRAVAFAALGACAMLRHDPAHQGSRDLAKRAGGLLMRLLGGGRRPDWVWFEAILAYDNPRLSQALAETGAALGRKDWIDEALATLRWICGMQISAGGYFRPIGSEGFGLEGASLPFDQQPLEAQAAIEAAAVAYKLTGDAFYMDHAVTAYGWFFGRNDRGAVLADTSSGRCLDGVTPRGANTNSGAESILAFQLSACRIRALAGSPQTVTEGTGIEQARELSV